MTKYKAILFLHDCSVDYVAIRNKVLYKTSGSVSMRNGLSLYLFVMDQVLRHGIATSISCLHKKALAIRLYVLIHTFSRKDIIFLIFLWFEIKHQRSHYI